MKKALLADCIRIAQDKLLDHPQYEHFPHWSFGIWQGKIIATGINRGHEPAKLFGYHRPNFVPKLHSELDCILKCRRSLRDLDIVNVRLNRKGEARLSMPCRRCRELLSVMEIKNIYFTTESGWGKL